MRGGSISAAVVLWAAFVAWPTVVHAQVVPVSACSACSATDFEAMLRLGPTFQGALALTPVLGTITPGFVVRVGTLAGLPIQVEGTLAATSGGQATVAGGLRILPLGWLPGQGLKLGGDVGVNLGAILGMTHTATFYAGPVVEVMVLREMGIVAEWVFPFGGVLRAPPSVNVGVKFALPHMREQAWR